MKTQPEKQMTHLVAHRLSIAITAMGVISALTVSSFSHAQTPPTQYWMDVATYSMMGMDEMPDMGAMGNLLGGVMGQQGRDGQRAKGVGNFGYTKAPLMGRWLDTALHTTRKPNGTEAVHQVPQNANLGAAPLNLVTPPREGLQGTSDTQYPERPKGRLLFYWGCSAQVKAGQPRILDFAKLGQQDYMNFMQGRSVKDRGARAEAGHAIWPNEKENSKVARNASLVGEHVVTGDGVPASMRFNITAAQDFMPTMQVSSAGKLSESVRVTWQPIETARAYMLTAISASEGKDGSADLIIWSASEPPESGMGLMDYISNGNIDKWLNERVLLPAKQTQCDVPAGIFANTKTAMLQAIAYGSEMNVVYPPRPANAKTPWNPEWSARVRVKSQSMNMLGEEAQAQQRSAQQRSSQGTQREEKKPNLVPDVAGALRGIFGK